MMFGLTGRKTLPMEVVDFADEQTAGKFRNSTIYVARKVVSDMKELLHTYVHEWAHNVFMDDLDMGHKEAMGYVLTEIALATWNLAILNKNAKEADYEAGS
jgi:hypothetical protein